MQLNTAPSATENEHSSQPPSPQGQFRWVRESAFGRWFQNSNVWYRYVVIVAIDDFTDLLVRQCVSQPGGPSDQPYSKLPGVDHLLDLGCGHGLTFSLMHNAFAPKRITAIDIDHAMLVAARERAPAVDCPIEVQNGDAKQIDAPDGTFDMVLCHQLLHHVSDQAAVLDEMFRVLKPGGVALIGETCKPFIRMLPIRVLFTHPMDMQKSADEYLSLVRERGFHVADTEQRTYSPWWSVPDLGLFDLIAERFGRDKRAREPTEVMMIARKPG